MTPFLSPEDLDRLVRSQRRLLTVALVAIALVVAAGAVAVWADVRFPAAAVGAVAFLCLGFAVIAPRQRLLGELGITREEAAALLRAERERRSGVALPARDRARRESVKAALCLAVGLVLAVSFVACAYYIFTTAGQVHPEGEPLDPWLVTSFFVGFVSLFAPVFLLGAKRYRDEARDWRRADRD
ncbi:hypothetical protein ACFVWN_11575 [Nocardiopsis flavescens]|uniref:hypothetical protein n=1 Tax=Nocardiopsis flavescens TaxID=758803 RepID=UPI00364D99D1